MHSAFWYWKRGLGRPLCERMYIDVPFQKYAQEVLAGRDRCGLLNLGHYALQLQAFFKFFSPSQFTILLFHHVTAPLQNRAAAISELWHSLGLQGGSPPPVIRSNSNGHPSLEQDLDAHTLAALQTHVQQTAGADLLARVLIAANQKP